jgi:hypothetical protein
LLPLSGRARERALLDAWREAHWTLRLKLGEVTRQCGSLGIEALYDEARRCDNLLNEFYQSRAEVLARQVREVNESNTTTRPTVGVSAGVADVAAAAVAGRLSVTERALLARVRAMTPDDRASLLRLAVRLTSASDRDSDV